eukprot:CAMPEP_0184291154 /NCGR_PEP_ID=MMETSP1049-20130417/3236_1 /TAXON_ID=77928 /ORGANISM="Proteomonas sulcata, Strain CCMP704" /LENGTH=112 /DNA_ID=CAMNT_0026598501 /DNA_START=85 /DNA_END=423 /DNA_ORIENTATION=-
MEQLGVTGTLAEQVSALATAPPGNPGSRRRSRLKAYGGGHQSQYGMLAKADSSSSSPKNSGPPRPVAEMFASGSGPSASQAQAAFRPSYPSQPQDPEVEELGVQKKDGSVIL